MVEETLEFVQTHFASRKLKNCVEKSNHFGEYKCDGSPYEDGKIEADSGLYCIEERLKKYLTIIASPKRTVKNDTKKMTAEFFSNI